MQVKKFEAPTMQEALKVIKRELGPEAIILSTKQNRSGFGLMSKASVEVTAAVAEKDLQKKSMAEKDLPTNVKEKIWNSKVEKHAEIYDNYFERQLKRSSKDKVEISAAKKRNLASGASAKNSEAPVQAAPSPSQTPARQERRYVDILDDEKPAKARASMQSSDASERVKTLERDIEGLKSMIHELTQTKEAAVQGENSPNSELVDITQDLVQSGIENRLARQLVRQAAYDLGEGNPDANTEIVDRIAYHLMQDIRVKDLLEGAGARAGNAKATVVALVGPTGVGKTTTIAKIASLGILEKRLRVGLVNLDSYKVAAADQLATYARIMNIPFRSVSTKDELVQAVHDFSSLDLILIDTTGRSQKDQESLLQLRHMLAVIENCQNALMLSATTKDSDMNDVVSRFKIFNPVGLVFSKLDETSMYGCIYNTQKRTNLPLLYFTVGQRVPEDIERASAERVVDLIMDL